MKNIDIKVLLVERFEPAKEWRLQIPAEPSCNHSRIAECVFETSNAPPENLTEFQREILAKFPRTGLRSVSVGDVIIISDPDRPDFRHVVTVERCGLKFH